MAKEQLALLALFRIESLPLILPPLELEEFLALKNDLVNAVLSKTTKDR